VTTVPRSTGRKKSPLHAPPALPRDDATRVLKNDLATRALVKLVVRQAQRMRDNTAGALYDLNPEFVHDLRVATRRARSLLRLLEDDDCAPLAGLRAELAWIAGLLGAVRDLDVFLERLPAWLRRTGAPANLRRSITMQFRVRRRRALAELIPALLAERYETLVERLLRLPDAPELQGGCLQARIEMSAWAMSAVVIRRAARKVRRWRPARPSAPADAELHTLRIAGKRLRYACEFFSELHDPVVADTARAMVRLQDILGAHQDAVIALDRLTELTQAVAAAATDSPERLLTLGALQQVAREVQAETREEFGQLWPKIRKQVRTLIRSLDAQNAAPSA
jgi:CHAD domain-containing protein